MKKNLHKVFAVLVILLSFTMSGCSELFDCVASTRPELPTKPMNTAQVGQSYNEIIRASVVNDSHDDDYDYYFSVDARDMPPGITYEVHDRRIFILGTPTVAGTYTFKIRLTIDYPEYYDYNEGIFDDDNRICFGDDSTSKLYTITVQ